MLFASLAQQLHFLTFEHGEVVIIELRWDSLQVSILQEELGPDLDASVSRHSTIT